MKKKNLSSLIPFLILGYAVINGLKNISNAIDFKKYTEPSPVAYMTSTYTVSMNSVPALTHSPNNIMIPIELADDPNCHVQIPVLMYHGIDSGTDYSVSKSDFLKQLDYLANNGFSTLNQEDIIGFRNGSLCPKSDKAIVLTFDEGYSSIYNIVYPELGKRGFQGISFIFPEGRELLPEQIREMSDSTVIEIGSHLLTHTTSNQTYTDEKMIYELRASKEILEKIVDKPVISLAWPGGIHNERDIGFATDEGYQLMFEAWGGKALFNEEVFEIPRLDIERYDTYEKFVEMLIFSNEY